MATILYDHQTFSAQIFGGISQSFSMLIEQFQREPSFGINPSVGCLITANEHLHNVMPNRFFRFPRAISRRRILAPMNSGRTRRYLKSADILHATFYFAEALPDTLDKPLISTIHDMTPELLPEYFSIKDPHKAKKQYCDKSDLLVCVSENTRQDLIKVYGVSPGKTRVVYHGIDLKAVQQKTTKLPALPDNYVLYVGTRDGYKDFSTLFNAMQPILQKRQDLHLVCIGGGQFQPDEQQEIKTHNLGRQIHQLAADDPQLRYAYRHARAFVYPSLYEGFGLPILEAFAQECPVVLSNASCFPEIAHDAALYFEPGNIASCTEALERVLSDDNSQRISKGLIRCQELSWHSAADNMSGVYRELL